MRTRDLRLVAALVAVAVLALGAVGISLTFVDPPPVPTVSRDVTVGVDGVLTLQFVGNTMLGDEVQYQIDSRGAGNDWPFDAVRAVTTAADFTVAMAEGPIGAHTVMWNRAERYFYSSRPEVAGALARAGVDAVQTANNHAYDTGPIGLAETIANLDAVGIASIGAGPDLARAEQPLLLRTEIGTIGIVAMGETFGSEATEDGGGTLLMNSQTIPRGVAAARAAGADWVIAFVQWGGNHGPVDEAQRRAARRLAAAGYDMVVAGGPHNGQPIEFIGPMPVVYSLGDFAFGTPGRWATNGTLGLGLVTELELSRAHPPRLLVRCLVVDNAVVGYQPRFCDTAQAQAFLPTLAPQLRMDGDLGVLPCPECFPRRPEVS